MSSEIILAEVIAKDPTDFERLNTYKMEWEKQGDAGKLSLLAGLIGDKLAKTEVQQQQVLKELRGLRADLSDIKYVTASLLVAKLCIHPELTEGFALLNVGDKTKLSYEGRTDQYSMYVGYERLHMKLINFYGNKEITYKTLSIALMKYFLRSDLEKKDDAKADVVTYVLTCAEFLRMSTKKRKFSVPELKKVMVDVELDTKRIKQILLDAGWTTITQGSCRTLLFMKEET